MPSKTCGACGTVAEAAANSARCPNCRQPLIGAVAARYYVAGGDQVSGPFAYDAMRQMVTAGQVTAQSQCSLEGGPWEPAGTCPELFSQQVAPPPAPPRQAASAGYATSKRVPGSVEDVFDDERPGDRRRRRVEQHRGGAVLTLGILGIVICFICGIIAWVMGAEDLRKMRQGTMDRAGQGTTQAGLICGIIGVCLGGLWALIFIAGGMRGL